MFLSHFYFKPDLDELSTWLREGETLVESVLQVTTAVGVGALHLDLGPATSSLLHDLRKHQQSIHHQVTR